jgi:ABC-type uncharacterized transport system permease subunit
MSALSYGSFGIAVVLYAAASTLFYLDVARSTDVSTQARWAPWFLGIAAAGHASYVVIASFVAHVCPVHSVHFVLSIASLAATAAYLVARKRFKAQALGLIVAPVGLVVALGTFFLGTATTEQRLPAAFTGFHVFANLVGVALFLLACGAAVMYLVQERRLKQKKSLLLSKKGGLPPLESLDKAVHRFLIAGFPLLTLGVITGTVWAPKLEAGAVEDVVRTAFGYAMWLLIGGVLVLRAIGWRGRRSAYGTVAGFLCAMVVLGIYLVRPFLNNTGG